MGEGARRWEKWVANAVPVVMEDRAVRREARSGVVQRSKERFAANMKV